MHDDSGLHVVQWDGKAPRDGHLFLARPGCQTPVGARTWITGGTLHMAVRVFNEADLSAPPSKNKPATPSISPKPSPPNWRAGWRSIES